MNLNSIWSALEEAYGVCDDIGAPAIEKFAEENQFSASYWSWGRARFFCFGRQVKLVS